MCSNIYINKTWASGRIFFLIHGQSFAIFLIYQKRLFDLFLEREELLKKYVLRFKPCLLTSLSSRKWWGIYEFSIEKNDFLIFVYTNFKDNLKKVIKPSDNVRFGSNFFFTFSLIVLKILRGQNFNMLFNSKNIFLWSWKVSKFHLELLL